MAHRLPLRPRIGPQRTKNADENATSKLRQTSSITQAAAARVALPAGNATKAGVALQRPVLNEVTTTAINRRNTLRKLKGKDKEPEAGDKRSRSASVVDLPQRVPLGPGRIPTSQTHTGAFKSLRVQRPPPAQAQRIFSREPEPEPPIPIAEEDLDVVPSSDQDHGMDVEDEVAPESEVEAMIEVQDSDEEEDQLAAIQPRQYIWPEVSPAHAARYEQEVNEIRARLDTEDEEYDATMVSEYADDIFEYMNELEDDIMPSATYMDEQNEITWAMRQTLIDWLLQVHLRYHMLPETLWIAVNIVDRFLTQRVVSLVKLQLVGVTAMFIASKYEEILAPSADEFAFMTENGYSKKEILKGERIVLQTLDFKVSHYCSPYSWMRKISKADDYDIQTRTLSKFLAEVTLLDHRFLRVKPSMVAAIGMYTARRMLGGDWNEAFVCHSGYSEEQLAPGFGYIVEKITETGFEKLYLYKKYAHKKFLKAACYAVDKAREVAGLVQPEDMME